MLAIIVWIRLKELKYVKFGKNDKWYKNYLFYWIYVDSFNILASIRVCVGLRCWWMLMDVRCDGIVYIIYHMHISLEIWKFNLYNIVRLRFSFTIQ